MRELALLRRMQSSPYAGELLVNAVLGIDAGVRWRWTTRACTRWTQSPVDAWLTMSEGDLDRMLAGKAPEGDVGYRLGDRDGPARLQQAYATLALATLGWCGAWPDPTAAGEHDERLRDAVLHVRVGPNDGIGELFPAASLSANGRALGLHTIRVRLTDAVHPCLTTIGLVGGDELRTTLGVQLLRIAAAEIRHAGEVPASADIDGTIVFFRSRTLPLATKIAHLWDMTGPRTRT